MRRPDAFTDASPGTFTDTSPGSHAAKWWHPDTTKWWCGVNYASGRASLHASPHFTW